MVVAAVVTREGLSENNGRDDRRPRASPAQLFDAGPVRSECRQAMCVEDKSHAEHRLCDGPTTSSDGPTTSSAHAWASARSLSLVGPS